MANGNLQPNSKCAFICGLENPVGLKLRIYEVEPRRGGKHLYRARAFPGIPGRAARRDHRDHH